MSSTATLTTFKVLGGLAATSILTGIGAAVGGVMAVSSGKTEQEVLRDKLIGSTIMSVPSAIIGIMVGAKPELKSAGYTQAVTSVLSFGLSLAGVSLVPTIQPTVSKRIAGGGIRTDYVLSEKQRVILA
jgi:hypothetical protein